VASTGMSFSPYWLRVRRLGVRESGGGCVLVLSSMMGVFVSVDCRTETMLKQKRREEREAKTISYNRHYMVMWRCYS